VSRLLCGLVLVSVLLCPVALASADSGADGEVGEASVEAPPAKKPFRFEITSPDGAYRLRLGLTAQIWLRYREEWNSAEGPSSRWIEPDFRRIRVLLSGNAFVPAFRYKLQLSFLPGQFEMLDLWADYAFSDGLRLRFGVWKIPFSRFRTRSFTNRQLVDWPVVSQYFGAERQLGIALHDGYADRRPPPFEWAVGVFTGVNTRASHGVGAALLHGPPAETESWPIHPEIVARVGYNHRGIDTTGENDLEGAAPAPEPFRFAVHLSGTWDLAPVAGQDWGMRAALEGLMKVGGYSLSLGGYAASIQEGSSPVAQRPGALGVWAGTGHVIARRVEVAGQYALIRPLDRETSIHEPRLGVNVFILGRQVQWRTDVGAVIDAGGDAGSADLEIRSVIQASI